MSRTSTTAANVDTAPVLGVLVCHDGQEWLESAVQALRQLSVRPQHVIAVDTGSTDGTADLLAASRDVIDGVVTLPRHTGFGAAVNAAVQEAQQRWGRPGTWLWLLHDDCAPEPDCLATLFSAAQRSPSAALLGPMCLDWSDPRRVTEVGVSTDATARRQTGLGAVEVDHGQFDGDAGVLAVSSAGALIRTEVWTALGGYDPALALLADDLDFGWRVNRAGHQVLSVPAARLRHAAAATSGARRLDAVTGTRRQVERAHGLRTYLANCSPAAFVTGLPRAVVAGLVLAATLLFVRGPGAAKAELAAVHYLLSGRAGLRAARAQRIGLRSDVTGLLTSRSTRLRNGVHAAVTGLLRRRVQGDVAIGRVPRGATEPARAALARTRDAGSTPLTRAVAGLCRYGRMVAVPVPAHAPAVFRDSPGAATAGSRAGSRPSPVRRDATPQSDRNRLLMVDGGVGKILREVFLSPLAILLLSMTVLSLLVNRGRLGLDLTGGRLLPLEGLGEIWSSYMAGWHPVGGGSAAPAPAALALLGVLGAPVGSPAAAVSLLLLAAMPLAGLAAYLATTALPVSRARRALAAAGYALLPPGIAGIAQGRLDVVLVFVLLPLVLAGTAVVLKGSAAGKAGNWLSIAAATALGLAVISAFAPLLHLLVLAVVLVGFVMIPAPRVATMRRALGLFAVVLLPLGLLIPWPAVVVQRPAVLLHGVGAVVPEHAPNWLHLLALDPGGQGAAPWVGALVVLAALVALIVRPSRTMLPGVGLVVLGAAAATALTMMPVRPLSGGDPRPGFTGGALLFVGCGLLWIALMAGRESDRARPEYPSLLAKVVPFTPWVGVAVLAAAALVIGAGGPLSAGPAAGQPVLAPALADELARDGTSVLVVPDKGEPVRLTRARTPRFGDDDIAPLRATGVRLDRVAEALRGGQPGETPAAISDVAATGVEFVVLPTAAQGKRALAAAGPLARSAPATADGRPVLRVVRPIPGAELLGPALAKQARTGAAPPIEKGVSGVLVTAKPPSVAVRVAPGAEGRLLVVAANAEPGWRAVVGGSEVPVVRGWGHQVAVPVPGVSTEVRVERSEVARTTLLLAQVAVLLLVVGTAIPIGRRREDD